MDFITHLPSSAGHTVVWVICDRLTKYAHFLALPTHFTAQQLARRFVVEIFRLHGMPKTIVSNRDPLFVSTFWRQLFKAQGTTLKFSSTYHPQTDGQTEVLYRGLEAYLRCFTEDHPHTWYQYLHLAELWHNTAHHSAIGTSPFHALYGRPPPTILDLLHTPRADTTISDLLHQHTLVLHALKHNLRKTCQRMCNQENRHHSDRTFNVDDWVWVRLQPYRQQSVERRPCQKLSPHYSGPYQISRRIGTVAYELKLPPSSRIHPVFHVSLLRLFRGPTPYPSPHPNSITNINSTTPLSSPIQTAHDPRTTPSLLPNQNTPTHLIPAFSKSPSLEPYTSPNLHKTPTTRNLIHNSCTHASTPNLLNPTGPPLETHASPTPHNNPYLMSSNQIS